MTMRAIVCPTFGTPDVMKWQEVPIPQPAPGEVLIKVAAAGVNRADILQRRGKYAPPEGASNIIGLEAAGEIVELGAGTSRWKVGDRVSALLSGGGYAEYVNAPEGQCLPVLPNQSLTEAAALPEALAAVWSSLFEIGGLKAGDRVLIQRAASGLGTTAIQMVKLWGGKVFVTVDTQEKADMCRKLGADFTVIHPKEDFVSAIERETKGQGVQIVLDVLGGKWLNQNLEVLAPFGCHVSIATRRGRTAPVNIGLVMKKRLMLTGSTLRSRTAREKTRLMHEIETKWWPFVASGELKPLIHKVYPIKNAADAHKMMASGAHIGKIVLEVGS